MGTPADDSRTFALYDWAGLAVQSLVRGRFDPKTTKILDIGAGWGKYRTLLPEYKMDACEVWKPYVEQQELEKLYDKVFVDNICDIEIDHYDAIIMGDVLEHLDKQDAMDLLPRLFSKSEEVYIVVPYCYAQDEVDDNPYEIHQQADLTRLVMLDRYPLLDLVLEDADRKGLYCWKKLG